MDSISQQADLGVIFALAIEAGCFVDALSQVQVTRGDGFIARQGRRGNREIVLVESGPGIHRAAKAAHALIDAHRPRLLVSAGFAGGLDLRAKRQDLIVATSLLRVPSPGQQRSGSGRGAEGEGARLPSPVLGRGAGGEGDEIQLDPAARFPWVEEVPKLHCARLLTFDRVVRLREEKRQLGRQYDALAVDMETFAVAQVCRERAIDFLAIRAISDAVDDELPPDIGKLLAQKSFAGQLGAAVGSLFRRPAAVKDLFNLHQNALASSARLAKFLGMLIERSLPALPDTR